MSWAFSPLLPGASPTPAGELGYVKVWMGSSWICKPVKVWNGSQWVIETAKWYNTSTSSWITPVCAGAEPPAGPARSYLGATSNNASSATSVTVATPEGAANGDLLVALLDSSAANPHNVPAGWTKVDGSTGRAEQIFTATHNGVATSYTFTTPAATTQYVILSAYRGYSLGVCSAFSAYAGSNPIAPGITVPVNDSIIVGCVIGGQVTTYTGPAGWTANYEIRLGGSRNTFQRDTLAPSGSLANTQFTGTAINSTAAQFSLSPV